MRASSNAALTAGSIGGPELCIGLPPQWRNGCARYSRLAAEFAPLLHQPFAPLEQVAAPVCGLDLVPDGMRQRHVDDDLRGGGLFVRPIHERRAEPMNSQV